VEWRGDVEESLNAGLWPELDRIVIADERLRDEECDVVRRADGRVVLVTKLVSF